MGVPPNHAAEHIYMLCLCLELDDLGARSARVFPLRAGRHTSSGTAEGLAACREGVIAGCHGTIHPVWHGATGPQGWTERWCYWASMRVPTVWAGSAQPSVSAWVWCPAERNLLRGATFYVAAASPLPSSLAAAFPSGTGLTSIYRLDNHQSTFNIHAMTRSTGRPWRGMMDDHQTLTLCHRHTCYGLMHDEHAVISAFPCWTWPAGWACGSLRRRRNQQSTLHDGCYQQNPLVPEGVWLDAHCGADVRPVEGCGCGL